MIWRIAWRNLWRHRGRTLIMGSAVAFIYGLTLISLGVADDSHRRMLEEATVAAGGEVLVHGEGYWATRASDRVIHRAPRVLEVVRGLAGVRLAVPRVLVNGLLSTSAGSSPVLLRGVVPGLEAEMGDPAQDLSGGTFLTGGRGDPLVLGARIVERLEVDLGDRVVLTAADPDGELTRALLHLTGILETGTRELDEILGYTTLEAARAAVGMEGMLTQVGVLTTEGTDTDELAARLRAALPAGGPDSAPSAGGPDAAPSAGGPDAALEVLSWRQAVPEMVGFIELDDAFGYLYMILLLVVVLFSITNTFLMAVMERVRELGLLNALGMRGERIGRMLLAETAILTVLAMGVGLALGVGGHLAVDHWGIPVAAFGLEEIEISGLDISDLTFYSTVVPVKWIVATGVVAVATVMSAVYPAWRASRLSPAEAMRFYE